MSPFDLLSVPTLRERGWTLTLIVRLLGEPDDLRRNPYYNKAPPMRLYAADRVEAAEQMAAFLEAGKRATRQSSSAKKGVETKRAALDAAGCQADCERRSTALIYSQASRPQRI
jgi:hypothetical protein